MEDDWTRNNLRALSVAACIGGSVVFGIFIGLVTESVESLIANADAGHSKVVTAGHVLICGWNSNTAQIVRDINAVGTHTRVVVLTSDTDRAEMMDELRDVLSEESKKRISISFRSGNPVFASDLDKVAASRAGTLSCFSILIYIVLSRNMISIANYQSPSLCICLLHSLDKIILVAGRGMTADDSDRNVISRALALRSNVPLFAGDIVAELSSPRDERILQGVLKSTKARSVEAISARRLLLRFMAQAVRQRGLADCVAKMMGENTSTVFHVLPIKQVAPNLVGMRFSDVRSTAIPGAILCGYVDAATGQAVFASASTKDTPTLTSATELLVLGQPTTRQARTVLPSPPGTPSSTLSASRVASRTAPSRRTSENILVCGWRPDMEDMLHELDAILPHGSQITILDVDAPEQGAKEVKLKNISLTMVRKRPDQYKNLKLLLGVDERSSFDHVLVLSSALGSTFDSDLVSSGGVDEDSKALSSMVYINLLLNARKDGQNTSVTVYALQIHMTFVSRFPQFWYCALTLTFSSLHFCTAIFPSANLLTKALPISRGAKAHLPMRFCRII
jgi:voltage-gated potassium channel Kch